MFSLPTTVTVSGIEYTVRTGKKLEKYERSWYNRNRDLVHLRQRFSKSEEEILNAWTS